MRLTAHISVLAASDETLRRLLPGRYRGPRGLSCGVSHGLQNPCGSRPWGFYKGVSPGFRVQGSGSCGLERRGTGVQADK